jgi:hypothetical protein
MAARIATFILGVWLVATGLSFGGTMGIAQTIAGLVVMAAEIIAYWRIDAFRWISFAVGLWLIAQPFVLPVASAAAAFNSYTVGLLVMVLAAQATHPATYKEPPTYNRELYAFQGKGRAYR